VRLARVTTLGKELRTLVIAPSPPLGMRLFGYLRMAGDDSLPSDHPVILTDVHLIMGR
jgi:hypothetical protein